MRYKMTAAALYFAALVWFAYQLDGFVPEWVAVVLIFVAPVVAGLVAGLWALPVPSVAFLFALPAGDGSGEIPIWFIMMFVALIALPATVIGWGARWLTDRYLFR